MITDAVSYTHLAGAKPVRNPEREKPKWEDTITNRMLHWSYTPEQKEEVKTALAAGVPKATILTYFYPEVTVERMSSYRKANISRSIFSAHVASSSFHSLFLRVYRCSLS